MVRHQHRVGAGVVLGPMFDHFCALVADTLHISTVDATLLVGLVPLLLASLGAMLHLAARLSELRAGMRYIEGRMDGLGAQVDKLELFLRDGKEKKGV